MDLILEVLDNFLRVTILEVCGNGRFAFCVLEDTEVGSMADLSISLYRGRILFHYYSFFFLASLGDLKSSLLCFSVAVIVVVSQFYALSTFPIHHLKV